MTCALGASRHLELREFYEHRFAPQTLIVTATIAGQKLLRFSSALEGQSREIISRLCEVAPRVETKQFMA